MRGAQQIIQSRALTSAPKRRFSDGFLGALMRLPNETEYAQMLGRLQPLTLARTFDFVRFFAHAISSTIWPL
jgi:hypothetical protein